LIIHYKVHHYKPVLYEKYHEMKFNVMWL